MRMDMAVYAGAKTKLLKEKTDDKRHKVYLVAERIFTYAHVSDSDMTKIIYCDNSETIDAVNIVKDSILKRYTRDELWLIRVSDLSVLCLY